MAFGPSGVNGNFFPFIKDILLVLYQKISVNSNTFFLNCNAGIVMLGPLRGKFTTIFISMT